MLDVILYTAKYQRSSLPPTTLGYGDISPVGSITRFLVYMGVCGGID